MTQYRGITALVTGASRGLGAAYADELARRGASVVLVARSSDALERVATRIRQTHGVRVEVIPADLGDREGVQRVDGALCRRGIEVDLLLNNAGLGSVGPFLDRPLERQLTSVDVNINGLLALTYLLGQRMRDRARGGIINVASTAAFQPMPYQASYAATKAFLLSFSEALAAELSGTGVQVMAVHPGPVDTGFFDGTTATIATNRADSPERVATQTLDDFAAGRRASYPGQARNRLYTWAPRLFPRHLVTALTGRLNHKAGFDRVSDIASPQSVPPK